MKAGARSVGVLVAFLVAVTCTAAEPVPVSTEWGQVVLGGGGAVPGVAIHPSVADVVYCRTDVGGCARWDEASHRWIDLLNHLAPTQWNHYGVAALALDPHDRSGLTVYAALGKYTESWASPSRGVIVRSRDGGRTWTDTTLTQAVASNRDQALGEALAVDPAVPDQVWFAGRADGLQRSRDAGATWTLVPLPANPDGAQPALAAVLPTGAAVWIATRDHGALVSIDGGATFAPSVGSPAEIRRLVSDGADGVWAAHRAGLALHLADGWHDCTPPGLNGAGIQAIAADPHDPNRILAVPIGKHDLPVFRSRDRGKTWERTQAGRLPTRSWWPSWHWFSSVFWIGFDPHHPGRAWVSDWYAVYRTDDVWAAAPQWTNLVDGHEEIVTVGGLYVPPAGPHVLISGAADVGGFAHAGVATAPPACVWSAGIATGVALTGIAGAVADPLLVAAVGRQGHDGLGAGGLSRDGGVSWTPFAQVPGKPAAGGRIAVDAAGQHLVWQLQDGQGVFVSADFGVTWQASEPVADLRGPSAKPTIFTWNQPLAADRVAPTTIYLLHSQHLWRSRDGGAHFASTTAMPWERPYALACAPQQAGELWIAAGDKGLWWSRDSGDSVAPITIVTMAALVAVGRGTDATPVVFILGEVGGVTGLWASRDRGAHWLALGDRTQAFGNQPNTLVGDPREPGRVFIGTNGSGIWWARAPVAAAP